MHISLQVLSDVLAGKRVEVIVGESAYWRTFGGDQSPEDLETALQLVYKCVLDPALNAHAPSGNCSDPTNKQHHVQHRSHAVTNASHAPCRGLCS